MLISLKSEYGLRAMMDIAAQGGKTPVGRAGIASRQQIPLPFLTQLLGRLVGGGLLISTRGPSGGYSLSRSPVEISLLAVITALQGRVDPANCASVSHDGQCDRMKGCGLAGVWSRLKSASEQVLEKTTLMDILSESSESQPLNPPKPDGPAVALAETGAADRKLDCVGDACPLPIVRIARKMKELAPQQVLEIWADDEGAKADIPAWCLGTGNDFLGHEPFGRKTKFIIRKTGAGVAGN